MQAILPGLVVPVMAPSRASPLPQGSRWTLWERACPRRGRYGQHI